MSEAPLQPAPRSRYSLRHLLMFTALVALGIAVGLAVRFNRRLTQQRLELQALSGRLEIESDVKLASTAMPAVADDFRSWQVYVPAGQEVELRLGVGAVSVKDIPPVVGSVRMPEGRHRVTLYMGDSNGQEYRYVVYLDGNQVIEKTMGSQWLPNGWSSASGISWPDSLELSPPPLQLAGKSYYANPDLGNQHYYSGNSDVYMTRLGFRLWIDQPSRTYPPASPFIGLEGESQYPGIGLRDGLRYAPTANYPWDFKRPKSATTEPLLRIEAEFESSDGKVVSSKTQKYPFSSWQVRMGSESEPAQTTRSALLQANAQATNGLQPVVEMKWDASQPDAVGLRLADTAANEQISRWRLRFVEGREHFWRELRFRDDDWIKPADALSSAGGRSKSSVASLKTIAQLDLGEVADAGVQIQWQTNEALPLQIVRKNNNGYAGLKIYMGLPVTHSIQIPQSLKPKLTVEVVADHPNIAATPFPGGPVFDVIEIELDAKNRDWVWVTTTHHSTMTQTPPAARR